MTIYLEIEADLEETVRTEAQNAGMTTHSYINHLLQTVFPSRKQTLSKIESDLMMALGIKTSKLFGE